MIYQDFNLSFSLGVFPGKLKIAEVLPVFDKVSKLESWNYKPIFLSSNLGKVMEQLFQLLML